MPHWDVARAHASAPTGRGLLLESSAVPGGTRRAPRRLGLGELGAVHHVLHHGHAAAGLRPAVQEGSGAGAGARWVAKGGFGRADSRQVTGFPLPFLPPLQTLNRLKRKSARP